MNKLFRVFFHELGHFVAREINCKFFTGTGSSKISLYPCELNPNEYCGKISPILPEGFDETKSAPVPLNRLATHLAYLIYGCVFQSYYCKTDLNQCFRKNGRDDSKSWRDSLDVNNLFFLHSDIVKVEREYFDQLFLNNKLDSFMNLDVTEYLIEIKNGFYEVDLQKLRNKIERAIEEHCPIYFELIKNYNAIIDEHI